MNTKPRQRRAEIRPAEGFPKSEPFSAIAIKAMFLWCDLQTERLGMMFDWEAGDVLGTSWRWTYFLRTSLRTLTEAEDLMRKVNGDQQAQAVIAQYPGAQKEWSGAWTRFKKVSQRLRGLRNKLGGHVDLENVGGQLVQRFARMDPKDLLPHEWDARIGMKGTLASRFLYLTLLGDEILKPSTPTAINTSSKNRWIGLSTPTWMRSTAWQPSSGCTAAITPSWPWASRRCPSTRTWPECASPENEHLRFVRPRVLVSPPQTSHTAAAGSPSRRVRSF